MAQVNSPSTLDGLFKSIYGDKGPINLLPDSAIMQDLIPFEQAEKMGKAYNVPVVLSGEQGFSYGDGSETITLNTEIAATLKEVSVDGAQIVGQASLNYAAAAKAVTSKQAFMSSAHLVVQNLYESASLRLEASLLYGRSGIGAVASLSTQDIILTAASFADALWSGKENAVIDVYQADGTLRQAGLIVTVINPSTYTVTVSGTTTGIAATDVVYLKGSYGKECYGLNAIMTNNASLFGIDASAFSLWKSSSFAAGGVALTMAKVLSASALAVAKGGLKGKAICLVHPSTFNNLNSNEAALRQYTSDDSKAKNGFDGIEYRYAGGVIVIQSHPMVKRGEAFIFNPKDLKRVGAQDISSQTPGMPNEELFVQSQTISAYLLRVYSHQAIFCMKPAAMVKITGIVPS